MHSFRMAITFMVSRLLSRDPSALVDVDVAKSHIVYTTASGSSETSPSKVRKYEDKESTPKSKSSDVSVFLYMCVFGGGGRERRFIAYI